MHRLFRVIRRLESSVFVIVALFFNWCFPVPAKSQTAEYPNYPVLVVDRAEGIISIVDEIDFRTPLAFERTLSDIPNASVLILDSPGGAVHSALSIAARVRSLGLTTVILDESDCFSACALIFFAGTERFARGALGLHQIRSAGGQGDMIGGQFALADVIDALNDFEVPPEVISLMLRTPPDEMYILSRDELIAFGLDGEGQDSLASGQNDLVSENEIIRPSDSIDTSKAARVDHLLDPSAFEYNASHILIETRANADYLVSQLEAGADFDQLARRWSTGPSGPFGGNLGWFGIGVMVAPFENALVKLRVGEYSQPIRTQFGWHVVVLNAVRRVESLPNVEVDLTNPGTWRGKVITGQLVSNGKRWYASLNTNGTTTFQFSSGQRSTGQYYVTETEVCFKLEPNPQYACRRPVPGEGGIRWYDENGDYQSVILSVDETNFAKTSPQENMKASVAEYIKPGECALIVASRPTIAEAREYVLVNVSDKRFLQAFRSRNGWIAISVGTLKTDEVERVLSSWKATGRIPLDSYCSTGANYEAVVNLNLN